LKRKFSIVDFFAWSKERRKYPFFGKNLDFWKAQTRKMWKIGAVTFVGGVKMGENTRFSKYVILI
jgi:hypothetical protein